MSAEILEKAFASTAGVLANVSPDQFDLPTPCVSWKVRDLLDHIVGGTTFFAVTAETGVSPEIGGDRPDLTAGDFKADFKSGAARAVKAFSAEGAMDKPMKLPYGELPGSVFMVIAATDTFTHGWDMATATGQSTDLDPTTAAQILEAVSAFLPDALRGADGEMPFGPRVEAPDTASAADKLAAFMGRQV